MTTSLETVRTFYSAIATGDTGRMVELMTSDIEWISVVDFNVQEKGSAEVMKKVFPPLMQEWESFSPAPSEFLVDGSTVVSLGRFACVHRTPTNAPIFHTPMCGMFGKAKSCVTVSISIRRHSRKLGAPSVLWSNSSAVASQAPPFAVSFARAREPS